MRKTSIAVLAALTIVSMCFLTILSGADGAATDVKNLLSPINPAFLKYRAEARKGMVPSRVSEDGGRLMGGTPSPVSYAHVKGVVDNAVANSIFPSFFDLRNLGLVPPIKDQGMYPTCWTFAALTSMESNLLPDVEADFSEWHLAVNHGFDYVINDAGNSLMTTAYFIRWSGPLNESQIAYGGSQTPGVYLNPVRHVQQAVFLPERDGPLDNDTIKFFVSNYGAVDFAFMWRDGYNDQYATMYGPSNPPGQNHRLAIVGWNDSFPAYRFQYPPPGPGAFIARNSWGDTFGEGGYCYISYYDKSIQQMVCFNNAEEPNNYGNNYQYDPLGHTRSWGQMESWGANIFTAVDNNPLEAVGFYVTDAGVIFTVRVYKHVTGADPVSGILAAEQQGTQIYAGYYTTPLYLPVPLEKGETFSVVVKFTNPKENHSVPIEAPIEYHSSLASANAGESFVSLDGLEWTDLTAVVPGSNVCIKAYSHYIAANVALTAERKTVGGWLIHREFASLTVNMDNLAEVPVSRVVIERSIEYRDYEPVAEFTPAEMVNGGYTFEDKYITPSLRYNYRATAYDLEGLVAGKSPIVGL